MSRIEIVIQSHLSDAAMEIGFRDKDGKPLQDCQERAVRRIHFVKFLYSCYEKEHWFDNDQLNQMLSDVDNGRTGHGPPRFKGEIDPALVAIRAGQAATLEEQLLTIVRAVANEAAPAENTNMADIRREAIKVLKSLGKEEVNHYY